MPKAKEKTVDDTLATVLDVLEKILSGQFEYADEGLQELDLYPGETRRRWPTLFATLTQSRGEAPPIVAVLHDASAFELKTALEQGMAQMMAQHVGNLARGISELNTQMALVVSLASTATRAPLQNNGRDEPAQEQPPQTPAAVNGLQVYNYNDWATNHAHSSGKDQQWALIWDVPNVPPFRVGATITLTDPSSGRRTRFQVIEQLESGAFIYKQVAYLQPKQ